MSELDALVDRRPMILKLAESQSGIARKNLYTPAWSLGIPQKDSKNYKEAMAMDACCRNVLSGALKNDVALSAFPLFVGYGFLSNLAQEGLIRAGVETIADDMTRKPVELYYDDEGGEEEEDKITKLKAEMVKYKVRERMNTAMLKDGYFGGCLVYIDVGELEDDEAELPLVLDEKTFKKGSLRGFKVIEPVNIAPGTYNTTDPTADDYFNPNWYYILGRKFHKSRFLYIASNETPLLLKAAYNFFGIPQAQLALDYVAHFVANRESAQELLNKFSLTCFGTDMSQGLQANGSWADLVKRMKMFNKMKNNNGTFVYNKETEELSQINTPLSGVREIVEMSLNLLTAIWRIPKIRYIGEGEGGLNASSVEQMRSYYDYINAMQEKVLTVPYETILKILQLNLGMTPDEKLMFKFPVLWDMDEQERANLNKIKADTMATYLANGIISQEEARRSLSMDRNSGFTMIDAEDVPEPVEEPLKDVDKEEQDEEDKQAMDFALTEDGRWITIGAREKGENGEDDEGRKGRHIYLDDGETPEEAIGELKKEDKKEEKTQKENSTRNIEKTETKPSEKSDNVNTNNNKEKQNRIKKLIENGAFGKLNEENQQKIKEALLENFKDFEDVSDIIADVGSIQGLSKKAQKEALEINKEKIESVIKETEARYMGSWSEEELIRSFGSVDAFKKRVRTQVENRVKKVARTIAGRETAHFSWNTQTNSGSIRFNENIVNDSMFSFKPEICQKTKYHPENCVGIKSTTDHEFGHAIERYILEKNKDAESYKKLYGVWQGLSPSEIEDKLSRYAATNFSEFIAEGYCEYRNNKPPRELAKQIGELLTQAYKEAKNG